MLLKSTDLEFNPLGTWGSENQLKYETKREDSAPAQYSNNENPTNYNFNFSKSNLNIKIRKYIETRKNRKKQFIKNVKQTKESKKYSKFSEETTNRNNTDSQEETLIFPQRNTIDHKMLNKTQNDFDRNTNNDHMNSEENYLPVDHILQENNRPIDHIIEEINRPIDHVIDGNTIQCTQMHSVFGVVPFQITWYLPFNQITTTVTFR